jgi:hypothetical protein
MSPWKMRQPPGDSWELAHFVRQREIWARRLRSPTPSHQNVSEQFNPATTSSEKDVFFLPRWRRNSIFLTNTYDLLFHNTYKTNIYLFVIHLSFSYSKATPAVESCNSSKLSKRNYYLNTHSPGYDQWRNQWMQTKIFLYFNKHDISFLPPATLGDVCTKGKHMAGWGTMLLAGRSRVRIPDEVIAFFNWPNPSSRNMTLGSTQPLRKMSTRNLPGGKGRPAHKADIRDSFAPPLFYYW